MVSLAVSALVLWYCVRTYRVMRFRCGMFCGFHVADGARFPGAADALLELHRKMEHPPLL